MPIRCCRRTIKILSFEPHLHAPGKRMCLEAIWGYNIQTLNCVGYDHNWVRGYNYTDESAPLLPRGTILHIIGYMDNSPSNKNVPDPRNWQGSGNRSVANMFIDLGARVALTDDQFKEEMAKRRAQNPGKDVIPGLSALHAQRGSSESRPTPLRGSSSEECAHEHSITARSSSVRSRFGVVLACCSRRWPSRLSAAVRRSRSHTRAANRCHRPSRVGNKMPMARSTSCSAT